MRGSDAPTPAAWRRPRRTGLPLYLWVVTYADGSKGWYWPNDEIPDWLFRDSDIRDDVEITIVTWETGHGMLK